MVRVAKIAACVVGFACSAWFVGGWVASWFYTPTPDVIFVIMLLGFGYVWYLVCVEWIEKKADGA